MLLLLLLLLLLLFVVFFFFFFFFFFLLLLLLLLLLLFLLSLLLVSKGISTEKAIIYPQWKFCILDIESDSVHPRLLKTQFLLGVQVFSSFTEAQQILLDFCGICNISVFPCVCTAFQFSRLSFFLRDTASV